MKHSLLLHLLLLLFISSCATSSSNRNFNRRTKKTTTYRYSKGPNTKGYLYELNDDNIVLCSTKHYTKKVAKFDTVPISDIKSIAIHNRKPLIVRPAVGLVIGTLIGIANTPKTKGLYTSFLSTLLNPAVYGTIGFLGGILSNIIPASKKENLRIDGRITNYKIEKEVLLNYKLHTKDNAINKPH